MVTEIETLKLNLGSRTRNLPGFKNMDIDPHPGVDYVGDVADLSQFAAGSVSEIYASHVLEHFPHPQTLKVLKEWNRVLAPGGTLYVGVPDFARAIELYRTCGLRDWVVNFLWGDQGYKTAFHYAAFDRTRLGLLLSEAGFSDSYCVDFFPFKTGDCSTNISNIDGKPVSLNMVATK